MSGFEIMGAAQPSVRDTRARDFGTVVHRETEFIPGHEPAYNEHRTLTPHPNPLPVRGEGNISGRSLPCGTSRSRGTNSLSPHGERVRVRGKTGGMEFK
jgi:hypothetical protein